MYTAIRNSLSPSPRNNCAKSFTDLQQCGTKIILLPRSARFESRSSKHQKLPDVNHSTPKSKNITRSSSARVIVKHPPPRAPDFPLLSSPQKVPKQASSAVANAKSNEIISDLAPVGAITRKPDPKKTGKTTLKREQTRATIGVTVTCRGRSNSVASDYSESRPLERHEHNEVTDEWNMLEQDLRLDHHLFSHQRSYDSYFPSLPVPTTTPLERRKSAYGRPDSAIQKDAPVQTSPPSMIPETPKVRTDEASLGSLKTEGGSLEIEEGEPNHCWACRMEDPGNAPGHLTRQNTTGSRYNVHVCGRTNLEQNLSLSSRRSDSDEQLQPIVTLDQIISAAKRLSTHEAPLASPSYQTGPGSIVIKPSTKKQSEVFTPTFAKKLLDSDEEGAGQLRGVPLSVSSSEDEEPALTMLEHKPRHRQNFAPHRVKPRVLRKATLDSTDDDAIRYDPPDDLEDNSDKELECLAKRNAYKLYSFPSHRSSFDMANVNLGLVHQHSWNSSFSIPLSTIMVRRRIGSIGAQGSFMGSLASEDEGHD